MIAILDPFSGIAGDMTLGALIDAGLDPDWLRALPQRLGLENIGVRIEKVRRGELSCVKVDFDIPPQPHGRHLRHIRALIAQANLPQQVATRADEAFTAITEVEAAIHGMKPEAVHLHEVGAVDAILDIVGSIWGLDLLGVSDVRCGPISLGDGTVQSAHGTIPVPAPATLKLLEGFLVKPGPPDSGELVTPTGAALIRILSSGPPPASYRPMRTGLGAGTKDFAGRANVLRLILAEAADAHEARSSAGSPKAASGESGEQHDGLTFESVVMLSTDVDDSSGEYLAAAGDRLREAGALDVVLIQTVMKKGRPGVRVEVLARPDTVHALQNILLAECGTLGVRHLEQQRVVVPRETRTVHVDGHELRVKVARLPDGSRRPKPELEDVRRVAAATGRPHAEVAAAAVREFTNDEKS